MPKLGVIVRIAIIVALYYLVYSIYVGLKNPIPAPGDSWDYHIPISYSIINGDFLKPESFKVPYWYFPASSEAINSVLILLGIPLTLSNIVAAIVLFYSLFLLARTFNLQFYYSLLFALTFITLNLIVRWLNAVHVDFWLAVFFSLGIVLLEKPEKTISYFLRLGFILGMLVGTKFTGLAILFIFALFYLRKLLPYISFKRILAFLIPFSIFGLFWYIRNFIFTGNPLYPIPFFKGVAGIVEYEGYLVKDAIKEIPLMMIDSGFAEYKIWFLTLPFAFIYLFWKFFISRKIKIDNISKLYLLGLLNISYFLYLPSMPQPWIMVSDYRFSYAIFIPIMLAFFIQAAQYKKEELIGYISLANMIMVTSFSYHPKLVLLYLPLALVIFRLLPASKEKAS